MSSRPPPLIERLVRLLVPPASHEHVLGDLSERYRSPRQYLAEALRTLPFVIASRVRRTLDAPRMGFLAFAFWFGVFDGGFQRNWAVAAIPTLVFVAVLTLRDAYRALASAPVVPTRALQAVIDVATVAAGVLLSQIALGIWAPDLLLSQWRALRVGLPLGGVMLFLVCLQRPAVAAGPPPASRTMSMAELTAEARGFESCCRRAIRVEIGAGLAFLAGLGVAVYGAPTPTGKIISALMAAGVLFVMGFLSQYARRTPMPEGLDFAQSLALYRQSLDKSLFRARTYMWWYVVPLAVGPAAGAIATILRAPNWPAVALKALLCFVVAGALLAGVKNRAVRGLRKRIGQLEAVTERA